MILLRLTYDSGKNRFVAETDEGTRFFLSYETVTEHSLGPDTPIDESLRTILKKETERMEGWEIALRKITRSAVSSHQIRTHLLQKNFSEESVENVLSRLLAAGLLNDTEVLVAFVSDAVNLKQQGLHRIRFEAAKKGFSHTEVDAAYDALMASTDAPLSERERAEQLAALRWPRIHGKTTMHRKKKLADYLVRCGYAYDTVRDIVDRMGEDEA